MLRPVRSSASMGALLVALCVGLTWNYDAGLACPSEDPPADETQPNLHIAVLEGEDGINIIKRKMAVKPVIEVRDRNNLPVAGVAIVFAAPDSGPRVTFAHGSNTFMTTTDASGRAAVSSSKPVGPGNFKIRVEADLHGEVFTTSIAQTNYITAAAAAAAGAGVGAGVGAATASGISATMIAIIGIGVAAAVGVSLALSSKGGGGSKTSSTPTGTIGSPGTPVITAP